MPTYEYSGVSAAGRAVRGTVEAESPRAARGQLKERGVFASEVSEQQAKSSAKRWFTLPGGKTGVQDVGRVARQLSTLVGAGVALTDALATLARQRSGTDLGNALAGARGAVTEGTSLADALARYPQAFPSMYVGMVAAGEASGALELVLARIAEHAEAQARLQARARQAMTYPTVMALVGGGIVVFLLAYVVPQVTRIFAEAQQALPLPTRVLMAAGSFLGNYGLLLLLVLAAAVLMAPRLLAREPVRRAVERFVLRLPWVGPSASGIVTARFAQTLSTMVSGGLPLVEALTVPRRAAGSLILSDALERAEEAVARGEALAGHLAGEALFDPMVVDMIDVGERSGDLEGMLARAADAIDEETKDRIETVAGLLEPAMIVAMSGVVLFVILAILLPVFEMNQLVR